MEECPWCEKEIDVVLGFQNLGKTIVCPHCGKLCEVEGDYCDGDGGWWFSLVTTSSATE